MLRLRTEDDPEDDLQSRAVIRLSAATAWLGKARHAAATAAAHTEAKYPPTHVHSPKGNGFERFTRSFASDPTGAISIE